MRDDFDLVVIGSGPAGEKGAAQAAYYEKSVAIVEQAPTPGGIAVSSAGIPTKTLRETVLYVSGFRQREVYGLGLKLDPQIALERLMTREAEVVTVMTRAVARNIERHGIEMIQGRARLGPHRTVRVSLVDGRERVLRARAILIATGSHQVLPAGVPFHDPDVHDPVGILKLDRIPGRLLVGGGRGGRMRVRLHLRGAGRGGNADESQPAPAPAPRSRDLPHASGRLQRHGHPARARRAARQRRASGGRARGEGNHRADVQT